MQESNVNNETIMVLNATMLNKATWDVEKKVTDDDDNVINLPIEGRDNVFISSTSFTEIRNVVLDDKIFALCKKKGVKMGRLKRTAIEMKDGNIRSHYVESVLRAIGDAWKDHVPGWDVGPPLRNLEDECGAKYRNNKIGRV